MLQKNDSSPKRHWTSYCQLICLFLWVADFCVQKWCFDKTRPISTVCKILKFTLTHFWQKFRESKSVTKEVTIELISRNIFSLRVNFSFFHTVVLHDASNVYVDGNEGVGNGVVTQIIWGGKKRTYLNKDSICTNQKHTVWKS